MPLSRRRLLGLTAAAVLAVPLAGCARKREAPSASRGDLHPGETPELRRHIVRAAAELQIPESLLHRIIQRESDYNPGARNGPYYGLMQILPQTARTMGYQGSPEGLLDPETNLRYAGRYLRGAWMVSGGNESEAVMWYSKGYYYEAKRLGLLEETGLRT